MRSHDTHIRRQLPALMLLLSALAISTPAMSDDPGYRTMNGESWGAAGKTRSERLVIPLYKSKVIGIGTPIKKISVGNPDIADILVLQETQIYIVGKSLGTTNVVLWDRSNRVVNTIDLEVNHDLESLKASLHDLLPAEQIGVHSSQGSIILSGQVSSITKMDAAMDLARSFLPLSRGLGDTKGDVKIDGNKVINLMQVGGAQQVMLEVKVAEMARNLLKRFDANFHLINNSSRIRVGAVSGGATFPDATYGTDGLRLLTHDYHTGVATGPVVDEFLPNALSIADTGLFASLGAGNIIFNAVIDAAKESGLAKILAEPTLTTLSGQEATFISGGEFPMPVPRGDDGITIEFKEFGIGLNFIPVVLDSDRINLKLGITVSELSDLNTVLVGSTTASRQFFVPALTKRGANSTVELSDGQTLGIAGLINENLKESLEKFPGLAEIPGLGALFRSQEFIKGQTELVIFVTPRFAKHIAPDEIRLPVDDFVEPSDQEFYLMGRLEGDAAHPAMSQTSTLPLEGLEGQFGHQY